MTGVQTCALPICEEVVEPHARELLGKALQSARQLLRLINDILDISRIESERLALETVSFMLEEVLADALSGPEQGAAAKGLEFTLDFAKTLHGRCFTGDSQRIGQVLGNLASNAVKFTEKGRVALRVGLEKDHVTGVIVRFEIEDTGIGIPLDYQARLFSLFEQGDGSSRRKYGGTGLGLVLSKRLVELMGGEIGVSSQEGQGSLFWFTVPLGVANQVDRPSVPATGVREKFAVATPGADSSDEGENSVREPVDGMKFQAVCSALLPMIEAGELQAQTYLDANSEILGKASPADFKQLRLALQDFDFDKAEHLLRALMSKHGFEAAHG